MSNEKVIRVSPDSDRAVRAYAKELDITVTEAANRLLATAVGRRAALARYAEKGARRGARKVAAKTASKRSGKGRRARG
jgi:hypothetical protein